MKVIYFKDIPGVAEFGDIKEVADGYARNYLFPNKIAKLANTASIHECEEIKLKMERDALKELKKIQEIVERLDGEEIEIIEKISDDGKLYGGIGQQKVAQVLKKIGFDIKKTQIILPGGTIKESGLHNATIKFAHGLEAEVVINVVDEV